MPDDQGKSVIAACALFFMLHLAVMVLVIRAVPYPTNLDEHQHLSYVYHVRAHPGFIPDYARMYVVDRADQRRFLTEKNYLQHPSFYYWILKFFIDPAGLPFEENVTRLRLVNMAMSGLAVLLGLFFATRCLERPEARVACAAALVMVPMIGVVGGTINNDNLALLGGALTLGGLVRLLGAGPSLASAGLIGAGFALGSLAKLSGGLVLGFWIGFAHLPVLPRLFPLDRRRLAYLLVLAGFVGVGISPYIGNILSFGWPLYMERRLFAVAEAEPVILALPAFLARFGALFLDSWAVYQADALDWAALIVLLGLSAFGAWHGLFRRPGPPGPAAVLAGAGLAAFFCVLVMNVAFIYWIHLETGHGGGMSVRYYLPLWGGVAAGVGLAIGSLRSDRWKASALLGVMALLLYSYALPLVADAFSRL